MDAGTTPAPLVSLGGGVSARMDGSVSTAPGALVGACADRPINDPIFALNAEARTRAAGGESIVNATLGALLRDDGSLAVLSCLQEALGRVPAHTAAAYAPISGGERFNGAVVQDLFGGTGFANKAVCVATAGASGAIHHAVQNFLDPGQAALVPDHHWGPYGVMAGHAGRRLETFRTFDETVRFDRRAFRTALLDLVKRQGRALVILNYPCNNPTGYSLDAEEWADVADAVATAGRMGPVAVLIDYAYARFRPRGSVPWDGVLETMLSSATVLVAWTASKSFTFYGGRVGALAALHADPGERVRMSAALNYSCRATWSNCNHMGLAAVTELLTDPDLAARADEERAQLVGLLARRVGRFNQSAAEAGLRHPRYEGGFFVSVFAPDAPGTAAAMRERGVFVVPMAGAVRVALCAIPEAAVERLVEELARA